MTRALNTPGRRRTLLAFLACIAAMTAVLYWRRPDAFYNPQLWGEDGNLLVTGMQFRGLGGLLIPYAGYYHTVPKLAALLANTAAPVDVPRAYAFASWLLLIAIVGLLFTPRLRLPNGVKLAMGLALVMTPASNEVFFNLANWPFIIGLVWLLLAIADAPGSPVARVFDVVCLTLAGLSSPFSIVLWPLFVARYLRERSRFNLTLLGLAGATAIVQVWNMPARVASAAPVSAGAVPLEGFLARIAYAFLGELVAGLQPLPPLAIAVGLAVVVAGFGWLIGRAAAQKRWPEAVLFGASIASAVLSTYVLRGIADIGEGLSGRHFYAFGVPLAWGLLVSGARWRWPLLAAMLAAFLFLTPASKNEVRPDLDWAGQVARCVGVERKCAIPINPVSDPPVWLAQFNSRIYAVPPMPTRFSARFGESIELLGYSVERSDGTLTYRLVWRAREALAQDYRLFVQIAPRDAPAHPLAQASNRPLFWPFPEARWERGEIVDDPIMLSLDGLPPGEYITLVSWRENGAPGATLPAYDAAGTPQPDAWVSLPTTIVVP
ncbi:MAG TPA: hypothetical protein PLG23_07540 [Thermoflexales bacterium]|nr:hypothetical protein [Thermoflexales bacterium]HRA55755.1 hypothetical protein [Thermoflexales bacterium]